jgi:hypothetical protein
MIFVAIAAYRDPECQPTVRDLFAKARYPDQINVGVFLQAAADEGLEFSHPRLRLRRVHHLDSKGACWARSQAFTLYDGEDYVLQIDSHMRFVQHWDEKFINMLAACRVAKPILSHYPPAYEPPENLVGGFETGTLGAKEFDGMGLLTIQGLMLNPKPRFPRPSAFVAGGVIFGDARWIKEVPYDPYLYFWGEEQSLSVRLWTNGWDIFAPNEPIVWHRYARPDPYHWHDNTTHEKLNTRSLHRVRHLFKIAPAPEDALIDFERYSLGTARTLAEYEAFVGVNYAQRVIEDRAKAADFALPDRPVADGSRDLQLPPPMTLPLEATIPLRAESPDELDWSVFEGMTWGATESVSGPGSALSETGRLREGLAKALRQLGIRSFVDAPCGDMNWMRHVDYNFERFVGVDLLPRVIQQLQGADFPKTYEFRTGNIVTDVLPKADAVFCRDCLVHLPFAAIEAAIDQWEKAGFEYVFATTFPDIRVNTEIRVGEWRMLNMQLAPFYWPMPLMLLEDNDRLEPPYNSKSIGVWRLRDIRPPSYNVLLPAASDDDRSAAGS